MKNITHLAAKVRYISAYPGNHKLKGGEPGDVQIRLGLKGLRVSESGFKASAIGLMICLAFVRSWAEG